MIESTIANNIANIVDCVYNLSQEALENVESIQGIACSTEEQNAFMQEIQASMQMLSQSTKELDEDLKKFKI